LLLFVGAAVAAALTMEYMGRGLLIGAALLGGVKAGLPWFVWAGMLWWMRRMGGGTYHPPVGDTPLTPSRKALVVVLLLVLVVIFTPIPLREAIP
ncbi:MAG: hypothetical protein GY811_11810, partial [Myxococcales bacterium]|nr:hypothetical protein [Myxococcales bacterium]